MTLHFRSTTTGAARASVTADVAIACDGVNSAVRRQFYPGEELCFGGINTWRGVTRAKPFLTGRSYVRIGSIQSGNLVIYPIVDDVDGEGRQLINWTAQVAQPGYERNDWNKPGRLEDFLPIFAGWRFDWLDVPDLIRRSGVIFDTRWLTGPISLDLGPRHPARRRRAPDVPGRLERRGPGHPRREGARRGPASGGDPPAGLPAYEAARSAPTARVVRTNREHPPDYLIRRVEELVGDAPVRRSRPATSPRAELRAALGRVQAHRRLRPRARDLALAAGRAPVTRRGRRPRSRGARGCARA